MEIAATNAVFQTLAAACKGQLSAQQLAQQLSSHAAFGGTDVTNPVAKFSKHIVDALPRIHRGFSAGETVGDQVKSKLETHNLLLQCLWDANCMMTLHPSVLRSIFEDGQKVKALAEIREMESKLQEERTRRADSASFPLHEAITAAGEACMDRAHGGGDRSAWEVFYACPSITVTAFLGVVTGTAPAVAGGSGPVELRVDANAQLARAVQATLDGARSQRTHQQQWFGAVFNVAVGEIVEPEWMFGAAARAALHCLAVAIGRMMRVLASEAPSRVEDAAAVLFDIADRLLNAYAAALGSADAGQQRSLQAEYAAARNTVLEPLLQYAASLFEAGADISEDSLQRVESLAEAHYGYRQLMDICDFLGDRKRLFEHMRMLGGDLRSGTEPMTTFVFSRLLAQGRQSELLDLAADFDRDLADWLRIPSESDPSQRLQLRWLHDLRIGDYNATTKSLNTLCSSDAAPGLAALRRLLSLQKLAALAADGDWPLGIADGELALLLVKAEGQLTLLQLQEQLGLAEDTLLSAEALIQEAIKEGRPPTDGMLALEAFAAAKETRSDLWGAIWTRLVEASNWEGISQQRCNLGDNDWQQLLSLQPVHQAAALVYSPESALAPSAPPTTSVLEVLEDLAASWNEPAREALIQAFEAGHAHSMPPADAILD